VPGFTRGPRPGRTPAKAAAPFHYVDDDAELSALVSRMLGADRYAIDTEFHRERTYYPQLALVQLAFADEIALVDPIALDPTPLAEVFAGPGLAVFHACDQDLEVLERSCGALPGRIFDTQIAAGFIGYSTPSLATLVEKILDTALEKGDQLTDWTRRPLEDAQLAYAANDVAYLLELHDRLQADLSRRDRLGWAEDECALALARERSGTRPDEAWWRLKQARQLRGKSRGVAQAVAAWRERRAQSLDQPVRFVLSDLSLVALAQRPPRSRGELEQVRGLDGRHLGAQVVPEILAAIEAGIALSNDQILLPPRPQGEPVAKPAVTIAAAWVTERAHELDIDPAILATRADLVAFLATPSSGRLANSWRSALVGEPIRRLAAGDAAIALDRGVIVMEERSRQPVRVDRPD
jgi:ribonuclease D